MTQKSPLLSEYILCLIIWSGTLLYSVYKFYLESHHLGGNYIHFYHVPPSWWSYIGLESVFRDNGDGEWAFWKQYGPGILGLLIIRTAVRNYLRGRWSLAVDMMSGIYLLGVPGFIFHLIITGIFFAVALAKRKTLTWCLAAAVVFIRSTFPLEDFFDNFQPYDRYLLEMTTCYLVIRSISFACDYGERLDVSDDLYPMQTFGVFLEYQFFLPLYFLGPHVDFNKFCEKYHSNPVVTWKSGLTVAGKVIAAAVLIEFFTHFVYPFSARTDIEALEAMDLWSIAGLGYLLGQFFQLKYVVLFGGFGYFSIINGVDWSPLPICVAWVHRYSLMWQFFDYGLYVFLKRNIYVPLTKHGRGPILSSLVCYCFVLFWHGFHFHIGLWVFTNWLALLLEKVVYAKIHDDRLRAVINAPIFLVSLLSNMCFLADSGTFGWIMLKRLILLNSLKNVIGMLILFYCASFAGSMIEKWKYPRRISSKPKYAHLSHSDSSQFSYQVYRDL